MYVIYSPKTGGVKEWTPPDTQTWTGHSINQVWYIIVIVNFVNWPKLRRVYSNYHSIIMENVVLNIKYTMPNHPNI